MINDGFVIINQKLDLCQEMVETGLQIHSMLQKNHEKASH